MKTELLKEKTELDSTQKSTAKKLHTIHTSCRKRNTSQICKRLQLMVYSKTGTGAQRAHKISILRDAQNLTGQDPGKPDLTAEMTLLSVGNQT